VSLAPDILSQTYSETMLTRKSVSGRMVGNPEVIQKRAWRRSNGDLLERDFWGSISGT